MPLEGLTCASSAQGPRITPLVGTVYGVAGDECHSRDSHARVPPKGLAYHHQDEKDIRKWNTACFCVCKTSGWAFWNWESPPGCSANTSTFRFWGALFSFSFSDGDLSWFPCLLSHGASRLVPSPFVLSRLVPSPFVLIVLTMPAGGLSQIQKAYDVLQTRNKPSAPPSDLVDSDPVDSSSSSQLSSPPTLAISSIYGFVFQWHQQHGRQQSNCRRTFLFL